MLWSRFGHMTAPESNGTLWEEWWLNGSGRSGSLKSDPSGRSDAQTESVFPPALFLRYILGLVPVRPGMEEGVLRYWPSSRLARRHGAIPTSFGLLETAWDVSAGQFGVELRTPPGTSVNTDLASMGSPQLECVSVDGRRPSPSREKNGFLVFPPENMLFAFGGEAGMLQKLRWGDTLSSGGWRR